MAERTTKMTESHGVMDVRGQSARLGLCRLDRGVPALTRVGISRARAPGSVDDRLAGLGYGPMGLSP
jgi:hypothetical protein